MAEGPFLLQVPPAAAGRRLDQYLADVLGDCSRAGSARLVRDGRVRVNDRPGKPGQRLHSGDRVNGWRPPPARPTALVAEPIPLEVIHEDAALIVVNKPPGLVVHPAPGHDGGTLVNALMYHCPDLRPIGGEIRPGIVHRLDKDTSGVLVAAKSGAALEALASQFKERRVAKTYLALVHGRPRASAGEIDLPIGRHPVDRKRMSTAGRHRRTAMTRWHLRERLGPASLMEVALLTGRTHQIRVHLAAVGHAVVGDAVYGRRHRGRVPAPRQMLHAWRLTLTHPVTAERISFEAPVPPDMQAVLDALRPAAGPPAENSRIRLSKQ